MAQSNQPPRLRLRTWSWANLSKYLRYCRTYGVRNATRLAFRKILRRGQLPRVPEPLAIRLSLPDEAQRDVPSIQKKISVIIPTRNAGSEFGLLLRKLKAQKGIEQIEIVVVDSGSKDETIAVARNAGAQVISIPPESFSHSFSRNQGAARTTGDYLLFMVQDALPLTDRWLWEMARALETNNIVAVSCAEYPRADSDLFYRLLLWNHYRSLRLDRDRIMQWDSSCTSSAGLRANAQLSGISLLITREIFQRYWYAGDYAEDLQLGIRLIRDRHKIAFLYRTRVLHSHNRPPFYFLKRGYVDARNLPKVLPEFTLPEIRDSQRLFTDISSLHQRLNSIGSQLLGSPLPVSVPDFMARLKSALLAADVAPSHNGSVDPALDDFVRHLAASDTVSAYQPNRNMIVPHLMQHFALLQEFLCGVYPQIDEILASDVRTCVTKIFALHSGTHLAYLYLAQSAGDHAIPVVRDLDRQLVQGV